ncbi:zincin-like metallopeptidase domain-containing protein [Burkholderia sp. SRS-W-2-2016]|uniref:zincin-like metallopeptidase domain-containing protein n=1 Tax=Burkholderia sp. SRS-W-2-2016 TaxID=1926878 RepID=UPI0015BB5CB7|nr:zincin-like metallopeptidase domain-containing protein [Burkholderia sp. SRS-W-2-2016]
MVIDFCRQYPIAAQLAYYIRETVEELYGERAQGMDGMRGGYITGPGIHPGRCDIPSGKAEDADDFTATLRHEVIGHFGLNTFTSEDKSALLNGISAAREEPTMRGLWALIDTYYAGQSESIKAEEVFALYCEGIEPAQHVNREGIHERGERAFRETCLDRTRPMRLDDLDSITLMVAHGLHDRTRTQRNFPDKNQQFQQERPMEPKKPFHEVVAERLIEQLKAGTAPWQRPWEPGQPGAFIPMNPTTGKRYKGINAIHLMGQGRTDSRWLTYKQAAAVDAQVRRGEKGTPIQYWKFTEEQAKTDDQGRPVLDAKGQPVMEEVRLERPRVFFATVFNAEQIDGLPPLQRKEQTWDAVERAERILQASGAAIHHGEHSRAFYRPATDSIHLPDKGQFPSADNYYATALHELGHWTGHPQRLDRDLSHPFGSEGYAKEELRAEIASMILGDELGIGHDPGQHAAYVGSWIKALQDDPLEIFRAAAEAEKIQEYVLAFEQQQVQEQTTQQVIGEAQEATMQQQPEIQRPSIAPADEKLAEALRLVRTADSFPSRRFQEGVLDATTDETLGFRVPWDWTGIVQTKGAIERDGQVQWAEDAGVEPQFFGVYARKADNTFEWLADVPTEQQAVELADRLAVIDAYAIENEHDQAAAFARIHEERVRRDPNRTDEDISAAKEARKTAEYAATVKNDPDWQRRAEQYERDQAAQAQQSVPGNVVAEKVWLDLPYKQKEAAKHAAGNLADGKCAIDWDKQEKRWYARPGADLDKIKQWLPGQEAKATNLATEKTWLAVAFEQREAVKAIAGKLPNGDKAVDWDKAAKCWYANPGADLDKLKPWIATEAASRQRPALSPEEEFADTLRSMGCVVSGDHPVMDGKKHRIEVEGDKKGEKAGFYVGWLDGHPAGYIKNNRTGIELKWKSKGYSLDPEQKASMQAEAAAKLVARAEQQQREQDRAAQRVGKQMADLVPVAAPTPYLEAKGITPQAGVYTDRDGQKTYIPAIDADGKQWTMQYIQEDGTKRFAKESRKEGCFHPIGGLDAIAAAPAIVIGEGYATAAQVSQALGYATVAAFDSGNLEAVAKALHEKYPDKPIVIAGDDDQAVQNNPGKTKAKEAARAVGGTAFFPIFAPGEQAANPKGFTDFNDLAMKSTLGVEAVERQVQAAVGKAIEKHQVRSQQQAQKQEQQHERKQERQPRAVRI